MVDIDVAKDKVVIDALSQEWQKKTDAIEAIVPRYDIQGRIDLITVLSGKRPNLYKLYQADVQLKGLEMLEQLKTPVITADLSDHVSVRASSLDAIRSKQVVEIAKSGEPQIEPSILDRISARLGRK